MGPAMYCLSEMIQLDLCLSASAGRRLRGKAFYYVGGKVFCEEDFLVSSQYKINI